MVWSTLSSSTLLLCTILLMIQPHPLLFPFKPQFHPLEPAPPTTLPIRTSPSHHSTLMHAALLSELVEGGEGSHNACSLARQEADVLLAQVSQIFTQTQNLGGVE